MGGLARAIEDGHVVHHPIDTERLASGPRVADGASPVLSWRNVCGVRVVTAERPLVVEPERAAVVDVVKPPTMVDPSARIVPLGPSEPNVRLASWCLAPINGFNNDHICLRINPGVLDAEIGALAVDHGLVQRAICFLKCFPLQPSNYENADRRERGYQSFGGFQHMQEPTKAAYWPVGYGFGPFRHGALFWFGIVLAMIGGVLALAGIVGRNLIALLIGVVVLIVGLHLATLGNRSDQISSSFTTSHPIATSAARKNAVGCVPRASLLAMLADHVWSLGELIDAAVAVASAEPTQTPPERRRQFRVIQDGLS